MKELTEQDKQRIKKEINRLDREWGINSRTMFAIAEYATRYEREQQQELRNKVIEEIHEELANFIPGFWQTGAWPILENKLESLKIK